jgi:hypothetical protein
VTEPLFLPSGDGTFTPTGLTRAPWGPDSMHGGAPGALMVGLIEQHEPDPPMRVVRVTADILRPVPPSPLRIAVRTVRPGRRVSVIDAVLSVDDQPLMRMSALRIRDAHVPLPESAVLAEELQPPRGPDECEPPTGEWPYEAFHTTACDVRFAHGAWNQPGPAFAWIRLLVPVLPDHEPTPVQRVIAAADFGNGVSATLPLSRWLFINPELTVHVDRTPVGEWIGLDAATHFSDRGSGTAVSRVYDVHGPVGHAAQSLLVESLA